jgi:hypothetical protein
MLERQNHPGRGSIGRLPDDAASREPVPRYRRLAEFEATWRY